MACLRGEARKKGSRINEGTAAGEAANTPESLGMFISEGSALF